MPVIIQSYRCAQCRDLIDAVDKHIQMDVVKAKVIKAEEDTEWNKRRAPVCEGVDLVFCNETCAATYISDNLTKENRP